MSAPNDRRASLCAVVPAAGRGSRLGLEIPKVFVPLFPGFTIWDAIHEKLDRVADETVLVLSPEGHRYVDADRSSLPATNFGRTRLARQEFPFGMGDAIFGAADLWRGADHVLIVWGDQFNVSLSTLQACVELHASQEAPALTLPIVRLAKPYVEYIFDSAGRLIEVRQSREGDKCSPHGFADVGVFLLTVSPELFAEWENYRSAGPRGGATREINFLPFLVHLSTAAGWKVARYECHDPNEALGINTQEDLARAREILQGKKP